jgi:hypothetical protein
VAAGGEAGARYVPAEVLDRLAADLTVTDVAKGRAEHPEGDPMRGFAAIYHAAVRLGEADAGESQEDWLGRVRVRDLTAAMERAAASLPNAPASSASSPPSVASGE